MVVKNRSQGTRPYCEPLSSSEVFQDRPSREAGFPANNAPAFTNAVIYDCAPGRDVAPGPSERCMMMESVQRPNLNPTEDR